MAHLLLFLFNVGLMLTECALVDLVQPSSPVATTLLWGLIIVVHVSLYVRMERQLFAPAWPPQ